MQRYELCVVAGTGQQFLHKYVRQGQLNVPRIFTYIGKSWKNFVVHFRHVICLHKFEKEGQFMIKDQHIKAGALTLGAMIVSMAATGETFLTSFLAMLLGAGLIFASQTLWR